MGLKELNMIIAKEKSLVEKLKRASPAQEKSLVDQLRKANMGLAQTLSDVNLSRSLHKNVHGVNELDRLVGDIEKPKQLQAVQKIPSLQTETQIQTTYSAKNYAGDSSKFERHTLKRLGKKEKKEKEKGMKKPSSYIKIANALFSSFSVEMANKKMFRSLKRDLVKANLSMLPTSYISVLMFTTLISVFVGLFVFIFLLFFNVGAELPIVTKMTDSLFSRFLKVFWIIFAVPAVTFLFTFLYPSMERKAGANKIDQELPFATIHMAAISGSMVEPSKIFHIIIKTKEYPAISKELTKLINEINVYGYDLVGALRNVAQNNPSKKLADLLNGVATTINSGGNLPDFFEKRSQGLLFEYRLEREKYTRSAETFMDIYISVVIAAPMIFMLLLMMIKISGLGISLSSSMITLLMVLGVTGINIVFLTFLHFKQPTT